jgi:Zn-dependent protease
LIFLYTDLISSDFGLYLTLVASTVFALLIGVGFHEFCHAYMANSLGDTLPARQGRVTLNPLAHLDPAGTMMMLFIGFGWGKPVQFNPFGTRVSPKTATLLVSLAGPMSNFVAAGLLAIPIRLEWVPYINPLAGLPAGLLDLRVQSTEDYVGLFLTGAVYLNVILGVFNLIPIHPLDGFKVVVGLLPDGLSEEFAKLGQYGPAILISLLVLPLFTSINPLREIFEPTVQPLVDLFTGRG